MNYLGRLLSGAHSYYRDLNRANITGAIDVIVIRQRNGTYKSTPFHVRFGKMGVLWPRAHQVEIFVNGHLIPNLHMRIGPTGKAYFEPSFTENPEQSQSVDVTKINCEDPLKSPTDNSDYASASLQSPQPSEFSEVNSSEELLEIESCEMHTPYLGTDKQIERKELSDSNEDKPQSLETTEYIFRHLVDYLSIENRWPENLKAYRHQRQPRLNSNSNILVPVCVENLTDSTAISNCDIFEDDLVEISRRVFASQVENTSDPNQLKFCWYGRWMSWQQCAAYILPGLTEDDKQRLIACEVSVKPKQLQNTESQHAVENETDHIFDQSAPNTLDAVCPLLPPIALPIWSPECVHSDEEREDERKNSSESNTMKNSSEQPMETLLDIPTGRSGAITPELETLSPTQDEIGYFSDEGEGGKPRLRPKHRRSNRDEQTLPVHSTLYLTSEQLSKLKLRVGVNEAVFSVITKYQGTCQCACFIYLWDTSTKLVISDIDGTITRSDWLGQLMPLVGYDWIHSSVVKLYDRIAVNGYQFIYLSSRPIGQARATRRFLHAVRQGDCCLPDGPILVAPFSVFEAFHKEVIQRKADEFKIACLQEVRSIFQEDHIPQEEPCPFVAGFGNRISDIKTYKAIGLKDMQIFTVNYQGQVRCGQHIVDGESNKDKTPQRLKSNEPSQASNHFTSMEKTDAPWNESNQTDVDKLNLTYDTLLTMVDHYFPQSHDRLVFADEYSDYTFWRT